MQLFREVRNQHTQVVRKAKASFFKQKFASCSTNSKRFWDTVKSMENKSTSSQLPTALRLGNTVTTDKSTIIENFNKHFSTAGYAFHLATLIPVNASLRSSKAKLINKQITNHFESHRTFSAMQSGFRAGHGCTSAMLKVLNDIITAIDKRHYCAAIFIDLAKAFDSVNHHILIGRLNSLGFSNDCLA